MSKAGFQCFTPVTGTVNVGNWDQMPNLGIELGGVEVGCITDPATGAITGKVFLVIEKSEDGATTTSVLKAVDYATGSVIDPYAGPISPCVPPAAPQLQAVNLEEMCLRVDGVAQRVVPVAVFDQATGVFGAPVYLDEMGNAITGVVTAADPCECSCTGPCDDVVALKGCGMMFDAMDQGNLTAGTTEKFDVILDGVSLGVVVHDYLATSDGVNKSTWYTPLVAFVNSNAANWAMSLVADVGVNDNSKPTWSFDYTGAALSTLRIVKLSNGDVWTMAADPATASLAIEGADSSGFPFGTPAQVPCA